MQRYRERASARRGGLLQIVSEDVLCTACTPAGSTASSVAKPYWYGSQKKEAWGLLALLVVLMLCETQLAVLLVEKSGEMTSALAAQEADRFWRAVRAALVVLAFAVPIYAFYYYMRDAFANYWRRWLTKRFVGAYLGNRKYYSLAAQGTLDNPDQRISEDINTFTGRSTHFLLIFLGSAMQLVAFSAVLWSIPRTLVAFLAVYALVGTFLALYLFGRPLIRLNFWQLRREADFRFGLMRVRENAESIAFYGGEEQEREHLEMRFAAVFRNFGRLIKKQRTLNLFQRAFSQLTLVVPSVILAERVLSGEIEVGRAVQAGGAFAAVLAAISLIVDNFESLSRFVAGIDRLNALSHAVLETPASRTAGNDPDPDFFGPMPQDLCVWPRQIERQSGDALALRQLTLYTPEGRLAFARALVRQPQLLILDEATSALDSANEAALYQRMKSLGTTLISIAHREAVLAYHTHVLRLLGDGRWELHAAGGFMFNAPAPSKAASP